jgi:hypothetical protein
MTNRRIWLAFAALAILSLAAPAMAEDSSGRWKVAGNVAGRDFTLDCKFQQQGEHLTGVCVDGPTGDKAIKGGRAHPLIKGRVLGDQISWTYVSSYSIFKFNVDYTGVRKGEHATGAIAAAGKTGAFTADHVGS